MIPLEIGPTIEPVSVYLDLVPGAKADLEVIARAALAFAATVRTVAYTVDPSLEFRIELVSGTESSLSLNNLLKSVTKDAIAKTSLRAVAFGIMFWLTHKTMDYGFEHLMDAVVGHTESAEVSQETVEAIVRKTIEAYRKQGAESGQQFFRELDTDPSISGVGATRNPGERPATLIPRSEFHDRSLGPDAPALGLSVERQRRLRTTIETLTLVSPVLLEGKRKWRFIGSEGEFGAVIKDGAFLDSVLRGRSAIPMSAGIRMEVELQTIEDPVDDGAWFVRERNVLRVRKTIPPHTQTRLSLPAPKPRKPPQGRAETDKR